MVVVMVVCLRPGDCDYLQASLTSPCSSCSSYSPCSCPSQTPAVDCEWSSWSWSACSVSCGPGGRQEATRSITRYSQYGGRPCGSVTRASRDCQGLEVCPTDCVWGQWSTWACSGNNISLSSHISPLDISLPVSCGEGNQFRTRDVARPAVNGGTLCLGKKYSIGGQVRPGLTVQGSGTD